MKTRDERDIQNTTKEKQTKAEGSKQICSIVKGWELNDFVVHLS